MKDLEIKEDRLVEWTLDDLQSELRRISLVTEPAHEEDFMMFSQKEIQFKATDKDRRIVTGPAMRANKKILRYDENKEPYYGFFSENTIRKASELFFKNSSNKGTNLEHEYLVDNIFVFESWIVEDPEKDKANVLGFKEIHKGDWYVSMKIENDIVWDDFIKTGLIKGFSVEVKSKESEVDQLSLIEELFLKEKDENILFEKIKNILK